MKFEEAYWTKESKLLSIDEITQYFKKDKNFFSSDIKECLLCPECKKPNLAYNNAATPYLSVYPNREHELGCSLKQDEMTSKEVNRFVDNPKNNEMIIRQMEKVALTMFDSSTKSGKTSSKSTFIPKVSSSIAKPSLSISKRLPRKRIDLKFDEEDFGCFKIFYGTVFIKWEIFYKTRNGVNEKWQKILMYNKNNKMVCKLEISPRVYKHIPDSYKKIDNANCNIVFLAKFKNTGKTYREHHLINSDFLIMEK